MATYSSIDLISKPLHGSAYGNAVNFDGSITTTVAPVTGDIYRIAKVPAGTRVTDVTVTNTDLGTTAPGTLQFQPVDGSAATNFGAVDTLALGTASANGTLIAPGAVTLTKDSYLQILFGTVSAGAAGTVSAVIGGQLVGVK